MKKSVFLSVILFASVACAWTWGSAADSATPSATPVALIAPAAPVATPVVESKTVEHKTVTELMKQVTHRVKPFGWNLTIFHDKEWQTGGYSVQGYPLIYWTCGDKNSKNRSLVLSSVHGDEVTPIYFGFRIVNWVKTDPDLCKGDRFVIIAPLVNPDGFFRYTRGTRTNYNKVDVNRNFITPEWAKEAHKLWREKYGAMKRYYPGDAAGDQPETKFQQWLIHEYKVTKILSVHAPLNFLDFDGPVFEQADVVTKAYLDSCIDLKDKVKAAAGSLHFYPSGTYPGSLGNYAGKHLGIPTLTVELPTIDASKAKKYFGDMEKGNRVFFDYIVKEMPTYLKDRTQTEALANP